MLYSTPETTTTSKLERAEQRIAQKPEIVGLQSYEYLLSNSADERPAFMGGHTRDPHLYYADISLPKLEELARDTHLTLMELNSGPRSAKVDALFDAIEVRYAELHMLELASLLQDPALPATERHEVEYWFKEANEAIFGRPALPMFAGIADRRVFAMLDATDVTGPAADIQRELATLVGDRPGPEVPRADLFTAERIPAEVAELIHQRFDPLVEHIDRQQTYALPHIVDALQEGLRKMGADQLGWRVEVVPNKDHLAVSAHRKVVEVGENRDAMQGDELQAKTVHELGVHVQRSINAERAGWVSAAYGQDNYLDFEEALANMCGSVYLKPGDGDSFDEYRYLIAGFAYGMDGKPKRDFRDCYEIIWRTMALNKQTQGKELTDVTLSTICKKAYQQTVRMFRGTPCNVPGLLFLKDLAYIHGKASVGKVLPLVKTMQDLEFLLAGKLDPTRSDHLQINQSILPGTALGATLAAMGRQ